MSLNPVAIWGALPGPVRLKIKHAVIAAAVAGGTVLIGDLMREQSRAGPGHCEYEAGRRGYAPSAASHAERYAQRQWQAGQGRGRSE